MKRWPVFPEGRNSPKRGHLGTWTFPSRPMNPVPLHREQLGFTPLQVQSDIPYKLYRTDEKRQGAEIPRAHGGKST